MVLGKMQRLLWLWLNLYCGGAFTFLTNCPPWSDDGFILVVDLAHDKTAYKHLYSDHGLPSSSV